MTRPRVLLVRIRRAAIKPRIWKYRTTAQAVLSIPWSSWKKIGNGVKQRIFKIPVVLEDGREETASLIQFWSEKNGLRPSIKLNHPPIYLHGYMEPEEAQKHVLKQILKLRDFIGKTYGLVLGDPHPLKPEEVAAEGHPVAEMAVKKYRLEINGRVYFWDESLGLREMEVKGDQALAAGVMLVNQTEHLLRLQEAARTNGGNIQTIAANEGRVIQILEGLKARVEKLENGNGHHEPKDEPEGGIYG